MKPNIDEENWKEQKEKLKQRFADLTDNDLLFKKGREKEIFRMLQLKLGKTEAELNEIIAALCK